MVFLCCVTDYRLHRVQPGDAHSRISQCLTAFKEDLPPALALPVPSPAPAPEPMQISFNPLTPAERERRLHFRLCLYCGESGHILQTCPVRPPRPAVSTIQLNPQISTLTRMTIQLTSPHTSIPAQALVDSGSSGNFISVETINRLHLKRKLHSQTLNIQTIQGKPLGRGKVKHCSPSITLQVGCLHEEVLSFLVLEHSTVDVVLGCRGSHNTLPKWIGEAMRFFSGAITVNNTVCSEYLLLPTHSSKIVPPAWRVPNQRHLSPYPTSTGRSRKYSVRKPLRSYHHRHRPAA